MTDHDVQGTRFVCDACGEQSCWDGNLMCDDAQTAGFRKVVSPSNKADAMSEHRNAFYDGASHLDDDGVCQCECPVCIGENDSAVWCTCSDCDVIACGMHGIPTA